MMWFQKWLQRKSRKNQPLGCNRQPNFRPNMEELEDRTVMSAAVVAASYFDSALYEFNANTGALLKTLVAPYSQQSVLSGPAGVAVGPDGNLYISSQNTNSIVEFNVHTNKLSTFIKPSELTLIARAHGDTAFAPAGLRFGPDGDLYVSLNGGRNATSGGAVVRFYVNNSGGSLHYASRSTTVAAGLVQPTEMIFGTTAADMHTLYVSNSGAGNVIKIANADGKSPKKSIFIAAGSGGLTYPSGLTWGPNGNLFVVDLLGPVTLDPITQDPIFNAGQILEYHAGGTFEKVFTTPGSLQFQFPSDAVFGTDGHLLTADLGPAHPPNLQGAISQFNEDGTFNQNIVTSSQFSVTGPGSSGIAPSQLTLYITAKAGGPYTVKEGSSLTLHAKASDLGNNPLTFSWDLNGDGIFGDVTGKNATVTWKQLVKALNITGHLLGPQTFDVRLEVSDSHGHSVTTMPVALTVNPNGK